MIDLKPCPFCGGDDLVQFLDPWGEACIRCRDCGAINYMASWYKYIKARSRTARMEYRIRDVEKFSDEYVKEHFNAAAGLIACAARDQAKEKVNAMPEIVEDE